MEKQEINPHIDDVAHHVGQFIEYWGFKHIHGKIWTVMFLADRPVDANYIRIKLRVSKSLVSMSINELLQYNVILTCPKKLPTQHFIANPNILTVITEILEKREAKLLLELKNSCNSLKSIDHESINGSASEYRINQLVDMVHCAEDTLKALITLKMINTRKFTQIFNCRDKAS